MIGGERPHLLLKKPMMCWAYYREALGRGENWFFLF
jgi:hypothetical protein